MIKVEPTPEDIRALASAAIAQPMINEKDERGCPWLALRFEAFGALMHFDVMLLDRLTEKGKIDLLTREMTSALTIKKLRKSAA